MSKIQSKIINTLEKEGYEVLKIIRLNKNGYPDILALKENEPNIWIECKEEKDTLKPLQKLRIDHLNNIGNLAVCYQAGKGIIYPLNYDNLIIINLCKKF